MAVVGGISFSSERNLTVDPMSSFQLRTLWISDVHLGFKECKAEFLLEFLRQSECEKLS